MAGIGFQYLAFYNIEKLSKNHFANVGPKFCQIINNPSATGVSRKMRGYFSAKQKPSILEEIYF